MPAYSRPLLNMMEHAYMVRNGADHFETYESSKIQGPLKWVAIPTKHDGRGYLRAAQSKNGVLALCGWWSLLQVAAKMPVHWLLADRDGPLDAEDIAIKTALPAKIYLVTFELMVTDKIRWLEKVPWDSKLDFAGNIAALISLQHLPADALDFQRPPAANSKRQRKTKDSPAPGAPLTDQRDTAPASVAAGRPAETSGNQRPPAAPLLQDSTGQTEQGPLPSPKGDQRAPENVIQNATIAKRLICEKILGGRHPGRMWSAEAENDLARKCKDEGGIPLQEILDIAEYRSIEKSDDIPELKNRHEPITETTLMRYWGDEATRARAYLSKYRRNGTNGQKKHGEPKLWRDFIRWKYGDDYLLPPTFAQLDDDQKAEWDRESEEWLASNVGQAAEALSVS